MGDDSERADRTPDDAEASAEADTSTESSDSDANDDPTQGWSANTDGDSTDEDRSGEDEDRSSDDERPSSDDERPSSDDENTDSTDVADDSTDDSTDGSGESTADSTDETDDTTGEADYLDYSAGSLTDTDDADAPDADGFDDIADEEGGGEDIWPGDDGPPADTAAVTGTDGGTAAAGGTAAGGTSTGGSLVDEGIASEGPESDEEMPLAEHIEEMIHRLAVVLAVGGIVTLLLYPGADLVNSAFGLDLISSTEVIDFLWNKHVPGAPEMADRRPRVYGPLELLLTELKVAALGGLVVALPVFVYETYLFMRPGLYRKERRYYLAAVPTSIVLAFVGIAFAHFVVLPAIFAYFTSYTTGTAVVAFGLKETFNLILILMGYNAIIFQIPLFIMLAIMMNLVTRTWLEDRRLLFWGAFLGLAFLVSPDPTGMAPIIIGATMITLFEGTLLALRWTRSGN